MRWGSGALRWVRPLHSILCCYDGEVVAFEVDGIKSGHTARGHRFLAPAEISARRFEDYALKLHKAHVIVDATARAETIKTEARNLTFAQGLELVEDETLFKEVAGLVEWPVVLMGEFDHAFLDVPPEVIITTIKNNQKCFCVRDKDGKLANKYVLVANTVPKDGGTEIIRGNNKVIAARLSDAKFFWDQDRKVSLESLLPKLDSITFHAKLGTQGERVKRIEALAGEIAKTIGADIEKSKLAARLSKADLVTNMVGEFPELQGAMGRYYALDQNIDPEVADAIRDHWKPQGPSDSLPVSKIGQAVALAEKLDTLAGFWVIDEKPTGSKDPFALRRAALGFVRIVADCSLRIDLDDLVYGALILVFEQIEDDEVTLASDDHLHRLIDLRDSLLKFFTERLKVQMRDVGLKHDYIEATFGLELPYNDIFILTRRVAALSHFFSSGGGNNLLAGMKRVNSILKAEGKKDGVEEFGPVQAAALFLPEEKALNTAVSTVTTQASAAIAKEDFEAAMKAIATLRSPVDAFFEKVTVNDADPTIRANRLALLNRIRAATSEVADFSKIEG